MLRDIHIISALAPPTTTMLCSQRMAAKKKPTKKPKAMLDSVLSTVGP
jgi:hypothetical protein